MKKVVKIVAGSLWALPFMAFAQGMPNLDYAVNFVDEAKILLDRLVVFLIALAIVWFIWNVIRYVMSSDDDKKAAAKQQMIWGVIALAVIMSVWGLVALLQNIFGAQSLRASDPTNLLPRR